ncbi:MULTISPECIES: KH domain-containing protein [Thermococcus]|uniref:RNA-processing protein n=1 Tax=Thermococcus barossii TaxID=54077 RepID=A0A2Z2MQW6_9EURY|nr:MULTISPECIES: KH domain-containing protein [Thermococcus]ASJ04681.1 RNA-processing protein [Thermococcus barossii]NJE76078.1 RNA-processing protein [Thermococcus sp. ES12]
MDEFERLLKKYERLDKDGRPLVERHEEEITYAAEGEQEEFVRIPKDRVAVVIGKKGQTKKEIERRTKTKIEIDSETGEVFITATKETDDPLAVWKARDVVMAIGRGFSPERAFRLFNEGEVLEVVNLTDVVIGNDKNALPRVRGRIIGRKGRTREIIEEMSGADVSVYGKTVAIIGNPIQVEVAKTAIEKLAKGSPHGVVYKYLERRKKDLELESMSYYEALGEEVEKNEEE